MPPDRPRLPPPHHPQDLGPGFEAAWYLFKLAMFCLGLWTLVASWWTA